ncbi:photosystem II assembly protein Psb34 [Sodalinema gerasimenkoae]|uniref:photosystem II assembly protein Psb34 n=1 Tax=Sodalinema gerasimenkoae TaxID=2862348 RepID=UPI0013598F78|nr:ssl1498 family light-harvesting-like protein [Sodalinema gerasimenkoae]MCC5897236.1 ssl1498 family light-harvesting-like protein [Phormidium sp. BM_Day4_Bin.17]TVR09531.1 MAG: ssl1498 family light-harvesting-like protein [Phormidium sp. GEM2.Bin31]UCJ13523.1 MAG: ssl1498 family light-harvesting-like protein [Phormidium sp. PBR-2020]
MPYVDEEGGRLNNYAIEPKMYEAKPPTTEEKRNYAILGALAALFVAGIIAVAYAVSTVS